MLVDATHPEETRVAIVDGNWLDDFDFERASKKQLKGNIYLAKVIRVEPSLQAAFVEYGGNRHGFLPFSEIHPDYFRIPVGDRPHDEPAHDDDDLESGGDSDEADSINAADIAAYAEDHEMVDEQHAVGDHHHAEEHDHNDNPIASHTEPQAALPAAVSIDHTSLLSDGPEPYIPVPTLPTGFSHESDASHDLGLITDFGNAATPMPTSLAPDAIPVEIVGGEVAEEEQQRVVRQPRPRYKIQEVIKRRQVMLIQVVKEERGNKGAALTTFLSLAGRYCVLMPNTDHGGGVSRKITSHQDRRRMKEILDQLDIPDGMAVILRTAGMEQDPAEIQRDLEYLLRLWNNIREQTLQSTAPTLIYEEANLIKRSLRDMSARDLDEILVAGPKGHQIAVEFMKTIMPDQLDKIKSYEDPIPLFFRYSIERQIDQLYNPVVQLRSGGYLVINPTEALVSIDVNSGRATRERHIESTAVKTNLEAAEEVARQLRLRDLAGLVVIDFIDMEDGRNNAAVERRLKESMRADRARLQIGRISPFGLMELSRQRLHPSLTEINFEKCPHCTGLGLIRSIDSAAISILRVIEEEGIRNNGAELALRVPTKVALYLLNQKRSALSEIERRYNLQVLLHSDDALVAPDYKLERTRSGGTTVVNAPAVNTDQVFADTSQQLPTPSFNANEIAAPRQEYTEAKEPSQDQQTYQPRQDRPQGGDGRRGGRNGYGRGGRNRNRPNHGGRDQQQAPHPGPHQDENAGNMVDNTATPEDNIGNVEGGHAAAPHGQDQDQQRRGGRRRGRRGGRGRRPGGGGPGGVAGGGGGGYGGQQREQRGDRPNNAPHEAAAANDGSWNQSSAPTHNYQKAAPSVPTSIHELDTTPREHRSSSASQSSSPPPYEVVSESTSDKPKGGWWRKLTGQ
jgi:ribonuclease E